MDSEPHISLASSILFLGAINSILFALALVFLRKTNQQANRYLGAILLIIGLQLLHEFWVHTGYIYAFTSFTGIIIQLDPLFAPLIYLYIQALTSPHPPSFQQTWIHYIPAILYVIPTIPFYQLDTESKLSFVQNGYAINALTDKLGYLLPISMGVVYILFLLYLVRSFQLLLAHRQRIGNYFSYREHITLNWLRNLFIVFIVSAIFILMYALLQGMNASTTSLMHIISLFYVVIAHYVGIQGLLQPKVYHRTHTPLLPTTPTESNKPKEKYKKSALTADKAKIMVSRLEKVMLEQQLYLQSNLTLPDLAEAIASSPQYVSQVLNEHLHMSFFDYVNRYRIEHAKQQLTHGKAILDVAYASGFNSKSAFYTAFKKHAATTPAQFKRDMANLTNAVVK